MTRGRDHANCTRGYIFPWKGKRDLKKASFAILEFDGWDLGYGYVRFRADFPYLSRCLTLDVGTCNE